MTDEPFGRQLKPVLVSLRGEPQDINYWIMKLKTAAEFKGDATMYHPPNEFTIYPRAVND